LKIDHPEVLSLATELRVCERDTTMLRLLLSILSHDAAIQIDLMHRFVAQCRQLDSLQSAYCRLLAYIAVPSIVNANFVMVPFGTRWVSVAQLHCEAPAIQETLVLADPSFDALLLHMMEADHIGQTTKSAVLQIWGPTNAQYVRSFRIADSCLTNASRGRSLRYETLHL
jgi:hypothetical protein